MKGFIEVTHRFYNHNNNEYVKAKEKTSYNINHIISFSNGILRTTEVIGEISATTTVAETYEEIKQLIIKSQELL